MYGIIDPFAFWYLGWFWPPRGGQNASCRPTWAGTPAGCGHVAASSCGLAGEAFWASPSPAWPAGLRGQPSVGGQIRKIRVIFRIHPFKRRCFLGPQTPKNEERASSLFLGHRLLWSKTRKERTEARSFLRFFRYICGVLGLWGPKLSEHRASKLARRS